jgi:nicotinate-nucleotide adenylyltransferase
VRPHYEYIEMSKMKTGLFFGSFNPIHNGHMAIARYMLDHGGIDQLWFVVSPQNPFKKSKNLLSDHFRLEMVNLAIKGDSRFRACDIEFNLPKPSYTINTLTSLRKKYPDHEFVFIMGADNFAQLKKWKDYERLISEYRFLIYPRPGFDLSRQDLNGNFTFCDSPLLEISSTSIRKAILEKRDIHQSLSPSVFQYIEDMNFYRK